MRTGQIGNVNRKQGKNRGRNLSLSLGVVFVLVLSGMIASGLILMRDKLLYNAWEMGNYLAESYSREEEHRISVYEMLLELGALYMHTAMEENASEEELKDHLIEYSNYLDCILGEKVIDPYAVINGKLLSVTEVGEFDFSVRPWYVQALESEGESVFTDVYEDIIGGKEMVTLSKKLDESDNVIAFDILMENFHHQDNTVSMPENSSYFLFDSSGELVYVKSNSDWDEAMSSYASRLLDGVQKGAFDEYSTVIRGIEGKKRGVYYNVMNNGWTAVVTFPVDQILHANVNNVLYLMMSICAVLLILIVFLLIRGFFETKRGKQTLDTLQILGDTYYGIYRINLETETYETIKCSPDLLEEMGEKGSYQHFLEMVSSVVERGIFEEFEKSFSMENIRKLILQNCYDFGGDYQRRFQEGLRWVNIKMIYKEEIDQDEVIVCFRDIDMEKNKELRQHEILEQALENSKRAAQKKSMFFSNMSHDMRTPLNAISGLTNLARRNLENTEKVEDYLQKIERSSRQLLALVNDVLDMSRLEQGDAGSVEFKPMDLCQCVRETAALFQEQAKQEGKQFELVIDTQEQAVYCDSFRLSQILNNLLSNAFKYSSEGAKICLELIQLTRWEERCKYQLVVRDTGWGMSKEFLEKIFEPFTRETRFSSARVMGTGLGMAIVKSLVQQLSGDITVESELGKGTVITLVLPLQLVQEKEAVPKPVAKEEPVENCLEGKRILVAEDNELNMEIAREFLELMGADVVPAWNGCEAVEIFQASAPGSIDAILMDMQMPQMDGCTACRQIRKLPRPDAKQVPVIAVTANAFAEDITKTSQAGMNAHVSKPVDYKVLAKVLSRLTR